MPEYDYNQVSSEAGQHVEEWQVEGMTCSNCAQSIEKTLEKEGLTDVSANFSTGLVRFKADKAVDDKQIEKDIARLGYKVLKGNEDDRDYNQIMNKFLFAVVFTIPLFTSMFLPFAWLQNPYVQLALATPVYALGFYHFGKSAWQSLKGGVPNMDVLIFIGATAAFGYSLTGTLLQLGPEFQFYETAATIITLVLLGNVMEKRAVKKTTDAIDQLSSLKPKKARMVVTGKDGKEQILPVDPQKIRTGEILQVNTGESIPLDGKVTSGDAHIDESMITGESLPVWKKEGAEVIGGTILREGNLRMVVNATGDHTVLSRIIDLVKNAQSKKPSVQQLADKVSAVFVPVVLSIAILTFGLAYWVFDVSLGGALLRSVAVLVISCPCAMGLATPTAVMVGIGKAAKSGNLIKGGDTLEQLAGIKKIVLDKTGTLTTGEFQIKSFKNYSGDEIENRNAIHQIETYSSHPIAESILRYMAGWKKLDFEHVEERKGIGMEATLKDGTAYQLGSSEIFQDGQEYPEHQVYLMKNGQLAAGLDLEDELKEGAKEMVEYFQSKGIEPVLLSGDKAEKTRQIAEKLGIQEYYAEKHPDDKLEVIENLSAQYPTAMVGDGINDAPALSRADMGISLGQATEIAMQSAQVLLLDGKLSSLSNAHQNSRLTLSTIKENLFWAFSYNIVAIPIAALGLLNPMFAALAMAFSDVMVIGNSLRLKFR